MKYFAYTSVKPVGWFKKIIVFVLTAALAVLALMFSALLLAVILIVGALVLAYVWWKTRELRRIMKHMRDFSARETGAQREDFRGQVIEGEVIRVERSSVETKR